MYEGIVVVFEVALAILHLLQPELMEFDCQVELTQHIRKRTLEIQDPKLLLKHVSLAFSPSHLPLPFPLYPPFLFTPPFSLTSSLFSRGLTVR
jgi:hypothetical protein